ncbi:hypothetical protein [Streptomyces sp. NPDC002851]
MTETPDARRLIEIARSLNRYQWQPTDEEIECGAAFFHLVKGMEEKERPSFPRSTELWKPRLRTENVAVLAEEVAMLRDVFVPGWRDRLQGGSPMLELVDMYVRGAQPVVERAGDVLAAWRTAALPEPTCEDIAYRVRYSDASAEEVAAQLRYEGAARWEEESPRRSLWKEMEPSWNHLGAVRSTMMAAVSGDVEY